MEKGHQPLSRDRTEVKRAKPGGLPKSQASMLKLSFEQSFKGSVNVLLYLDVAVVMLVLIFVIVFPVIAQI